MAKKNPFDTPPPSMPTFRPDAKIENADWCKIHGDVDATGKLIKPKAVPFKGRKQE